MFSIIINNSSRLRQLRVPANRLRGQVAKPFSSPSAPLNAYPQYSVYGENCLLTFKVMTPTFRVLPSNVLILDGNKKGRILLEWIPRSADGTIERDNQIRFALSPEEAGLVLDQISENQIELSRRHPQHHDGTTTHDSPNKILRITPDGGGTVTYTVDFELDGVGSQAPATGEASGPLSVTTQLGEQKVIEEILRSSIPALTGWTAKLQAAIDKEVHDAKSKGGMPF